MTYLILTALIAPLLMLGIDIAAQVRAVRPSRRRRPSVVEITDLTRPRQDYTLIVPIYGSISYLENAEWLSQYGDRVLLATTGGETEAFYRELSAVAERYGFRVHIGSRATGGASGRRSTGGTARDTVVRDAHAVITSPYVVCIDADTVTERSVDLLVGAFAAADLDLGSVPMSVANADSLLTRLQRVEYRMSMRLRRIMPWMVCGGCHIARREVHADLMRRHSLFFQGNDVELGLLAGARGYTVGHVNFVVPTVVPDTVRGWWRQRLAWAGGEFRLTIVNIRHARRHPYLYIYGAVITFALAPFRWWSAAHAEWMLLAVVCGYMVVTFLLNRGLREPAILIYPLYAVVYALVLVPLGALTYVQMAIASRNTGVIDARPRTSFVRSGVYDVAA